jgi:elongation factor 1-alpha
MTSAFDKIVDDIQEQNILISNENVSKTILNETNSETLSNENNEVCIVTTGSVDAGKSSFIGVIAYGELDDGNGLARAKVAKHPHEVSLGKTSDISTRVVRLNETQELVMVDLCGHEKYLKTTLFGITGYFPDYGILVVAANKGLLKMTREHMGILLYMEIPFIIVVTRIDIAPPQIYEKTISNIKKIVNRFKCRIKTLNNMNDFILTNKINKDEVDDLVDKDGELLNIKSVSIGIKNREQDALIAAEKVAKIMENNHKIIPCVTVSNKTGYGIDISKKILENLIPRTQSWTQNNELASGSIFFIDDKFTVKGVGLVVSGIVKGNTIIKHQKMFIGPYGGKLVPITVRSIHNNTEIEIDSLGNRHRGCLAVRVTDKKIEFGKPQIRKGMIVVSENIMNNICYQFKCSIKVLNHSTTISKKYSPVIHCGIVRQTARIILDEDQTLKMGDKEIVSFRFVDRPEFMEIGTKFFFREGTTRGVGDVTEVLSINDDPDPDPAPIKKRNANKQKFKRLRPNNKNSDHKINIL